MSRYLRSGGMPIAVVVCCSMLLGVGVINHWAHWEWVAASDVAIALDAPLSTIPLRIGVWEGVDIPLEEGVVRVAGADDYINRNYVEKSTERVVSLYVAYTARPVKMAGHRPQVCYPANGWRHERTESATTDRTDDEELAFLVHQFTRRKVWDEHIVVLNYYVLAGRHVTDSEEFRGLKWRGPNLTRDVSHYVAQVQIASDCDATRGCAEAESRIRRFAGQVAPLVDALLPQTAPVVGSSNGKQVARRPNNVEQR